MRNFTSPNLKHRQHSYAIFWWLMTKYIGSIVMRHCDGSLHIEGYKSTF